MNIPLPELPSWVCPGCTTACEFKVPSSFNLPIPAFPDIILPDFAIPALPPLPTLPTLPEPLFKFAGTLPSLTAPEWEAVHSYVLDNEICVQKPYEKDIEGKTLPGQRKTYLTYKVIDPIAPATGKSGETEPVWGAPQLIDADITWKLTKTYSGIPGTCPNAQGSKK